MTTHTEYRCPETIDLEELIMMKDDFKENLRVIIEYNSGRTETFEGKVSKTTGKPGKRLQEKIDKYRTLPTVKRLRTERF